MDVDAVSPEVPLTGPHSRQGLGDRLMRKVLLLDALSGPASPASSDRQAAAKAQNVVFPLALLVSAVRCVLTYLILPALGPVLQLTGDTAPIVGIVIGAVSMAALYLATRRFFAADHRWRWRYAGLAGAVSLLLIVQAAGDVATLIG